MKDDRSILIIGGSKVGKTHYGAQLLGRLNNRDCGLAMDGAANVEAFSSALDSLNRGVSAAHTATSTYVESIWPVKDHAGNRAQLLWPDYGGEQVKSIMEGRRVPAPWRERVVAAPAWLVFIRLHQTSIGHDIFSRPLRELKGSTTDNRPVELSDQAKLVELLQTLIHIGGFQHQQRIDRPKLLVALTFWDELRASDPPPAVLKARLPLVSEFIDATWQAPEIWGLAPMGRALSTHEPDSEVVIRGPEQFGFIVRPDGTQLPDLTLPIRRLMEGNG